VTGRHLRTGGAALLAAALLAGLAGCATADPADEATAPAGQGNGNGNGQGNAGEAVPGRTQPTLPPVAKGRPAEYGNGVNVTLVDATSVEIAGEGPGETSGPGVLYTLRLHNRSGALVPLEGTTVSATYGSTSVGPSLSVGQPFAGTLGPGAKTDGTYGFVIPADQRGSVTLFVTFSPDVPVASITAG
jgi:hypothetical protein